MSERRRQAVFSHTHTHTHNHLPQSLCDGRDRARRGAARAALDRYIRTASAGTARCASRAWDVGQRAARWLPGDPLIICCFIAVRTLETHLTYNRATRIKWYMMGTAGGMQAKCLQWH